MNVQVERKDISRIGHTSMGVNGYVVALCSKETSRLEYILLRSVLKCFGEDYKIVATFDHKSDGDVAYATNLPWSLYEEAVFENKTIERIELKEDPREHLERWGHLVVGPWRANCCENTFKLINNGIQLAARGDEDLEKIIFDVEKMTVAVSVKNPLLPEDTPRMVDLSDAPEFFEELRNDIEILLGKPELVKANADRTVFEISGIKVFKIVSESGFQMGNWSASCWGKTFKLNNHGIKLVARSDEDLEKVIFDAEKKTVAVSVKNPTLPEKCPRIVDLSDAPEFFEELRNGLEKLLTIKGKFKSVTPNADRTVFEVS